MAPKPIISGLSGPKGTFLLGNLEQFGRDPLVFLEHCVQDHGDFVPIRFVNRTAFILNDPAHIECVLTTQARNFSKTVGYRTPFMRRLFGEGLLTSEGEHWMRQRRLAQPAFHRDRIATYARTIVEFTEQMSAAWKNGETREIHNDMMRLTTQVVTKTLFNSPVPPEIDELSTASTAVMERFTRQWKWYRLILALFPALGSRRFEQVVRRLDAFIYGLIRERRATGRDAGDLLSMLLQAREEDGAGMTDEQVRDELITLMVAGLDTTALAITWAFYLLSQNQAAASALEEELATVLGGRPPGFADLPLLNYSEMIVKETMRLYPPAWLIGRAAIQDCEIGGHPVKAGNSLLMSQWLMHRDPRYFKNAGAFVPERWREEEIKQLPKFAYFPFGGGPRICIGSSFAMMEATLVVATISQKFRLVAPSGYRVQPWPAITLYPKDGISLIVQRRESEIETAAISLGIPIPPPAR